MAKKNLINCVRGTDAPGKKIRVSVDADLDNTDSGTMLRSLIERPEGISALGVYDAMSARLVEMANIQCIYAGGYSAAGAACLPDMGILTLSEMVEHMRKISNAVRTPVVADIDDGYGGIHNVLRAVTEILALPQIAGVHLEDQKLPKRCGHIAGKDVIPIQEFMPKLMIALKTRDEIAPKKLIIARTDAFSAAGGKKDTLWGGDMAESVQRGVTYAKAGADVVWCEFPTPSLETAREFSERMRAHTAVPLGFNISPSFYNDAWEKSDITEKALNKLGYKFRFSTYPLLQTAMFLVLELAHEFKEDPITAVRLLKKLVTGTEVEPVNDVIGVKKYQAREQAFDPATKDKIEKSEGYR